MNTDSVQVVTDDALQETVVKGNKKDNAVYLSDFRCPGRVLIFNHENFDPITQLTPRPGSTKDAESLRNVLQSLNFEVDVHNELSQQEIMDIVKLTCERDDWAEMGCIMVIVLTHGEHNGKLWSRDKHYHTSDIWRPFCQEPALQDKQKIFMFQACRGTHDEVRSNEISKVNVSELNKSYIEKAHNDKCACTDVQRLPDNNDVLIAYSTMEFCKSWRDNQEGTLYIQALCKELQNWSTFHKDLITSLTQITNHIVENNMGGDTTHLHFGQTPTFTSYMTKDIFYSHDGKEMEPILYSWTDYKWRGRALIFCDSLHTEDAICLQEALEALDFTVVLQQIDCHETYLDYIASMADSFTYEGCILVAVLTKYDERVHFGKQLPLMISTLTFTESRITLVNKPKILLFFDTYKKELPEMLHMDEVFAPKHTTEHSDFFIVRGFGQEFFDEFVSTVLQDKSIVDIAKTAIQNINPNINQQRSHFESTLRAKLIFDTGLEALPYQYVEQTNTASGGIHYNIVENTVDFYVERQAEMNCIKHAMLDKKSGYPIDVAITGLPGVGKSQLAISYIKKVKEIGNLYKNILWLNASNKETLIISFLLLAKKCNVLRHVTEENDLNIINQMYDYFQHSGNTLFIFDNTSADICKYLPANTVEYPNIYIICTTKSKLDSKVKETIDLDVFKPLQSAEFLSRRFVDLKYETEDISQLSLVMGHMPLALNIAAAYIVQESKKSENKDANCIKEYTNEVMSSSSKQNDHISIIVTALQPTLKTVENLANSKLVKDTLQILSYLDSSNRIPTELFLHFIDKKKTLNKVFDFLIKTCLITCNNKFTYIHNLVQIAVQRIWNVQEHEIIKSMFEIFESLEKKYCNDQSDELSFPIDYSPHGITLLKLAIKYPKLVNEHARLPISIISDLNKLFYSKLALELGKQILNCTQNSASLTLRNILADTKLRLGKYQDALDEINTLLEEKELNKDYLTLAAIYHNKALTLHKLGRLEESLAVYDEIIFCNSIVYGEKHTIVFKTKNNKALLLSEMDRGEEALDIYFDIYDEYNRLKIKEDGTTRILLICDIARTLSLIGHFFTAKEMYDASITQLEKQFGKLNGHVMTMKHNRALLLGDCGVSNAELLAEFKILYYDKCEAYGKYHPSTQHTGEKIAALYGRVGSNEEAQRLYNDVLTSLETTLGKLHPTVLTVRSNATFVLQNNGQYFAAFFAYQDIYRDNCEVLGPNHTSTLDVREKLAYCLFMMDNDKEALMHYDEIIAITKKKLGQNNPGLQITRHNRAMVLNKLKRNEEALREFLDIIRIDEDHYGMDHSQTLRTKERVANVLRDMEKFNEALILFNDILPKLKTKLGSLHQDVTAARVNRAQVLHHMGKYASAIKIYYRCMKIFGRNHHLSGITTSLYHKAHDDLLFNSLESSSMASDDDDDDISDEFEYSDGE